MNYECGSACALLPATSFPGSAWEWRLKGSAFTGVGQAAFGSGAQEAEPPNRHSQAEPGNEETKIKTVSGCKSGVVENNEKN